MYECPICNRTLGKIDKVDETEFYCNRCKINSISFPEPNAYDKFCEYIKSNREKIIKSKHESSKISKKQDFVENLFGHSTSEEIPKIKKIPISPTVRKIMDRLGQDSDQINKKLSELVLSMKVCRELCNCHKIELKKVIPSTNKLNNLSLIYLIKI